MKKFFLYLFLVCVSVYFSSCSLGFLAKKQQFVSIPKDSSVSVLIDKQKPIEKDGKYLLNRDGIPKQIDLIKDGYISESKVVYQNKYSKLFWAGIAANTVVGGVLGATLANALKDDLNEGSAPLIIFAGSWFGFGSGTLGNFLSPKLMNYEDTIRINSPVLKNIVRDSTMKEVFLNKSSFDVSKDNVKYQLSTYKNYIKGNNKFKHKANLKKNIKIENSIFTDEINSILKKNGFIDTSGLVLKGSYNQNIFLNVSVDEIIFKRVMCNANRKVYSPMYYEDIYHCFSTVDIKTKWDVLDIYKKIIYSDTLILKSPEIYENSSTDNSDLLKVHISNAMEKGIYTLMNTTKFRNELKIDKNSNIQLAKVEIIKPSKFVNSLEEAVEASVTIKTASGHGSGFLISENGHIITNAHVISDTAKIEVILNNGTKYTAKLLQINKEADLAVVKIEKTGFIPLKISDSEVSEIGMDVYAIGTPEAEDLSQTLSKGIISAIRKQSNGSKLIQTDVSVNSGNSGGPLVDINGNLQGVVNAKLNGNGIEGISFAIPVNLIFPALNLTFIAE